MADRGVPPKFTIRPDEAAESPQSQTGSMHRRIADAVTPGIHLSTYMTPEGSASPDRGNEARGSYFSRSDSRIPTPGETAGAASGDGAGDVEDVLRKFTLARGAGSAWESLEEIRAANPDVGISGNIISATFTIPHQLKFTHKGEWELSTRPGQSALFDSFAHLSSSDSPWNHTVVAWTGEIDSHEEPHQQETNPDTTVHLSALNSLSAPIPVETAARLPTPPPTDGLWVSSEAQRKLEEKLMKNEHIRAVPVWLADDHEVGEGGIHLKDQARWRRYAENDIYTLFHYKQHVPSDGRKERLQWADYYRLNKKFANQIAELHKPGDLVIVHDYSLMLLPSMLRQRVPGMTIAFFLHCPFPSSELLRCLPRRKEILEGVLGSNLVGFQSFSYSRHFTSCCTRVLGFESDHLGVDAYGARVQVGVFPIGIDAGRVEKLAWEDTVTENVKQLKKMYEGKKIIVGRDRLDTARGVAQKLQAFDRFLELYPEWRDKVVLIQITTPTVFEQDRDDDSENLKTQSRVNDMVMKINGQYGNLSFAPVQHFPQYLQQDEYLALLRAADIGLITSVRDGMNTTSLEYVVCQRENTGPLILSEFSGTAASLADAIHINPWDLSDVASNLDKALSMSRDKCLAMQTSLYHHVTTNTCQVWIRRLVGKLMRVAKETRVPTTPLLDRTLLLKKYRPARKRLFMFDYDGTLTPIVREPSAAIPSERVIKGLRSLVGDERNAVWIISGRDQEFLGHHLGGIEGLGFSAEHGSFMRYPGETEWVNLAEKFDMSWKEKVIEVFERYCQGLDGAFVEEKRCAVTWHYRLADPEKGAAASRQCQHELESTIATQFDVEVMPGKANIEVRPRFINKGEIAKRLVKLYNDPDSAAEAAATDPKTIKERNPEGQLEFVLCLGDDFTDEDMFRALNGAVGGASDGVQGQGGESDGLKEDQVFTVTVGASTKVTLARCHLLEPEDVVECVVLLAGGERTGEVNLAALADVEGFIPDEER